ncbi:MAG: YceI family protein [Bryobacterales bacterium]|nr:YceI family protein [Bryobacterales bacterium]
MSTLSRWFALVVFSVPAWAAQYSLELTPQNTTIEWVLGGALHDVHGTFALKSGKLRFDPDTGAAAGEIVVDATSGKSGNGSRDKRMHQHVLESGKYPDIVFVPKHIEGKASVPGESAVKLQGTFTIHGAPHEVTMAVTMDVQQKATADKVAATAKFEVPYVEWGMKDPGNFLLKVDKKVQLVIRTEATLGK